MEMRVLTSGNTCRKDEGTLEKIVRSLPEDTPNAEPGRAHPEGSGGAGAIALRDLEA